LPNLKEIGGTKKLSKRHGPVAARGFLEEGYLPEALVNYLMFLGWNPGSEKEIYSLDEFVQEFTLEKVHKADLVAFDRQKLDWFNSQYIKLKTDTELAQIFVKYSPKGASVDLLSKIAPLVKERMKKLSEFPELTSFFFSEPMVEKTLFSQNYLKHLSDAAGVVTEMSSFSTIDIGVVLQKLVGEKSFQARDFFMDMRIAITGKKISPPLNESMEILGKEAVLARLANAQK
jgi:glutamyl-tRNA synthetase